jgi:CDP-diacylglycerol--glycerol-3-phosphate 3-phosphatidyltransferase
MNGSPAAAAEGRDEGGRLIRVKVRVRQAVHAAAGPLVRGLVRRGVTPDQLTVLGCAFSLLAALVFFEGWFRWGAALAAAGGLCDILDGEIARERGTVSKFGAFLDSTLDRLGEAAIFAGLAGFYVFSLLDRVRDPAWVLAEIERGQDPRTWAVVGLTAVLALVGSVLVSYTRARAEGLGIDCRVGLMERSERMVLLIVAGAFGVGPVMPGALLLVTVLSFTTAAQRVVYVWRSTRDR